MSLLVTHCHLQFLKKKKNSICVTFRRAFAPLRHLHSGFTHATASASQSTLLSDFLWLFPPRPNRVNSASNVEELMHRAV